MSRTGPGALLLLLGAALGCRGADEAPAAEMAVAAPADSLVLTGPGGVTVWFTGAREAAASDGTACTERVLEIRTDSTRVIVPLLFTREAPTVLEDTTMRAVLYTNCAPVGAYRVDYATASPRRLPDR